MPSSSNYYFMLYAKGNVIAIWAQIQWKHTEINIPTLLHTEHSPQSIFLNEVHHDNRKRCTRVSVETVGPLLSKNALYTIHHFEKNTHLCFFSIIL